MTELLDRLERLIDETVNDVLREYSALDDQDEYVAVDFDDYDAVAYVVGRRVLDQIRNHLQQA